MRAREIINEVDYTELFKQIDAERAAGVKPKHPVIGGVERTPELIRKEILGGGTLETEPVDKEAYKKWSDQQKVNQRSQNFLGIGDMLNKADELRNQKAAAAKAPAVTTTKSTTLSQPMRGGGSGGGQDLSDPSSWQSGINDVFQTSFDPKPLAKQMKYDAGKRGY
jgi:hypothetical protein